MATPANKKELQMEDNQINELKQTEVRIQVPTEIAEELAVIQSDSKKSIQNLKQLISELQDENKRNF
jgi:signal transduction histidine kinase